MPVPIAGGENATQQQGENKYVATFDHNIMVSVFRHPPHLVAKKTRIPFKNQGAVRHSHETVRYRAYSLDESGANELQTIEQSR